MAEDDLFRSVIEFNGSDEDARQYLRDSGYKEHDGRWFISDSAQWSERAQLCANHLQEELIFV